MKISVGVSNRHVHLTKETYDYLFDGKKIEKRNDLNQIGEFASTDTVDLVYKDRIIEHVRVLGPFRNDNQIELLGTDLTNLGLDAPVRRSGDLEGTPGITLKNGNKTLDIDHGVIRAERHVHVPTNRENELNLHERDIIEFKTDKCTFNAQVKVSDNGYFELHIDKDEAAYYGLSNGDIIEGHLCGN